MPSWEKFKAEEFVKGSIKTEGKDFEVEMMSAPTYEFGVIIDIDWMSMHNVLIDC